MFRPTLRFSCGGRNQAEGKRLVEKTLSKLPQRSFPSPQQLELQFLNVASSLMLDIEIYLRRDSESLPRDLDGEWFCSLERVCKPTELGDELRSRVRANEITIRRRHGYLQSENEPNAALQLRR